MSLDAADIAWPHTTPQIGCALKVRAPRRAIYHELFRNHDRYFQACFELPLWV